MRRTALAVAALLGLAATGAVLAAAAAPDIDQRVDGIVAGLKRASVDELWAAHRQLAELGKDAVPALKSRLAKARPAGQFALAKALCALGHPEEAIDILVGLIRAKRSPELGALAATVLGEDPARDVPATERELLRLADEPELAPEVARSVARALYFTATNEESFKRANGALRRLLVGADDAAVRRECALALAEIQDFAPPVEEILNQLADEPTPNGRLARVLLQNRNLRTVLIRTRGRETDLNDRLLNEVKALIQKYHVEEPLPTQKLVNAAAKGMVAAVRETDHPDRHSAFFDEDDWKKFREHIAGRYGGIGAVVQFMKHFDTGKDPVFTIARPNYQGPAYKAGLRSFDRIVEINGEATAGKETTDIVEILRGDPGTPVEVAVTSPGSSETRKLKIVRAEIDLPSVRSCLLPARIGYVRLSSFGENTAPDLDKALRELEKERMVGLILDLRSNPGGQLSTAVAVADKFLKDNKLIVYTEGRNKEIAAREEFRTKDPTTHPDYPIVVLVNAHSASASEIVAGALQDHQRAVLVGTKTYGKGSVQKLFPMRATAAQSGLKLTIAKYYLPSGRSIHGKGVEPDIKIAYKPTFTQKDFEHLRETGAFHRYTATRFAEHKDAFGKLVDFDDLDPARYPGFEEWHKAMAGETGRDKARRLLRAWLRILIADDRGVEFVCDFEEDNQLQRAILEVAKQFDDIDPKKVPEYRAFATKPPELAEAEDEKDNEDAAQPEGPEE